MWCDKILEMELLIGAHDPEGRMISQIPRLKTVMNLFTSTKVAITPATVSGIKQQFKKMGVEVLSGSQNPHETKLLLLQAAKSNVFCTELDKLLHLQMVAPEELEIIASFPVEGFILLGRTKIAFDSYPESWQVYESQANTEIAKLINAPGIDIGVTDFVAAKTTVDLLKNQLALPGWQCAVEMPATVILAGHHFSYKNLDGYSWEDPDRYQAEIAQEGFESWRQRIYDSEDQWKQRKTELKDYLEAISRFKAKLTSESFKFDPGLD